MENDDFDKDNVSFMDSGYIYELYASKKVKGKFAKLGTHRLMTVAFRKFRTLRADGYVKGRLFGIRGDGTTSILESFRI